MSSNLKNDRARCSKSLFAGVFSQNCPKWAHNEVFQIWWKINTWSFSHLLETLQQPQGLTLTYEPFSVRIRQFLGYYKSGQLQICPFLILSKDSWLKLKHELLKKCFYSIFNILSKKSEKVHALIFNKTWKISLWSYA